MIEWSEQHLQIREMVRRFVESEIVPKHDALEFGDEPPYAVLRKMVKTFGLAEMAKARSFRAGPSRRRKSGRCRCSRSTRSARGRSPSPAAAPTRSAA